jgi:hypothetical protein
MSKGLRRATTLLLEDLTNAVEQIVAATAEHEVVGKVLRLVRTELDSPLVALERRQAGYWGPCTRLRPEANLERVPLIAEDEWLGLGHDNVDGPTQIRNLRAITGGPPVFSSMTAAIEFEGKVLGFLRVARAHDRYGEADAAQLRRAATLLGPVLDRECRRSVSAEAPNTI